MSNEEKVYYPATIADTPLPGEVEEVSGVVEKKSAGIYQADRIPDRGFPTKKIAYEVMSSSLNTKSKKILAEFEFTEYGALQIGKYLNGVSGDLRISPNGITARDSAGNTTFALDGSTGSAVFAGTIQSGTLIAGMVVVGDNRVRIDGENGRILIDDLVLLGAF